MHLTEVLLSVRLQAAKCQLILDLSESGQEFVKFERSQSLVDLLLILLESLDRFHQFSVLLLVCRGHVRAVATETFGLEQLGPEVTALLRIRTVGLWGSH